MLGYYDRLQGTDRLLRIRRIRKAVFAGILALTLVLIAARLGSDGASLKPFFLPLNGVIEVGLMMGLVTAFVGLYLRLLEIRKVQRDGQRYLMAKSSMARAFRTAGFAIGLAVILLLAITPSVMETIFSDPPQVIPVESRSQENVTFESPDALGVTFVTHVRVLLTLGEASVSVLRNKASVSSQRMLRVLEPVTLEIEPTMWAGHATWTLHFQNPSDNRSFVQFSLEKGVVPTFFSTVPFLLFLYGAAQVPWWVVLRPIRERTKASSLVGAASVLEEGERVFDDATVIRNPEGSSGHETIAPHFPVDPPPPSLPPPVANPPKAPPVAARAAVPPAVDRPKPLVPPPVPRPPPREPETAQSLARTAKGLVETGAYEKALELYEEALRLDPQHLPSLEGQARCLVHLEHTREALTLYRRILDRDPKHTFAWQAIARIQAADRSWRECLETLGHALRLRPNDSAALELKGDALTNLGRRPEALSAYEAAAAVNPSDESLRQKIEEVRVDVPGLLSRALIASASGSYPHALSLFDAILEVDEGNVNALIGKAVAYRRSGKPQEALNCLDLVLGIQPNNASALLHRGNILVAAGNLAGALEAFDRLTEGDPGDDAAWAAKGDVLVKMGRVEDALRAYSEVLKISPGDEDVQRQVQELEAAKAPPSEIFEELFRIKGIGKARAQALIDAGFRTRDAFAKASLRDLMAVRGITRAIAEELRQHFASPVQAAEQVLK
ncbi:MAG: tetratricopeptide repeat protein [Methanobacteriota archaeon]|nr:MAG: tetratricopeptide repeat protein [Euryarchaeota archaeon]